MSARRFTKARMRGLEVLAIEGTARRSNVTDRASRYVYWQTADWLVEQDLAAPMYLMRGNQREYGHVRITNAGRAELAAAEGVFV